MSKTIVDKAKKILVGIEFDLELAKNWSEDTYDNYYQYFSHQNIDVRKYSLLVFAAALGNWHLESAQIFRPIKELKKYPEFNKDKVYHFKDYVQSFHDNKDAIKQDFPLLYNQLVWYLLRLDNKKRCEYIFGTVDKQLLIELRQVLTEADIDASVFPNNFNDILKEVEITPYFLD